ncbi:MAG TPA: outer membrane protein assembly factor BamA [Rickettsiales bacterium]|nr:outer membrane protein assembly factor BamA [Rickettsiales bacterium]
MLKKLKLIFFFLSFFSLNSVFGTDYIKSTEIIGNERIDKVIIDNYLKLDKNSIYSQDNVNNYIKTLYETGLFKKVNIDYKNSKLIIKVIENPFITEIDFDGNKKIDDEILLSEISSTKRSVFNKNKLSNDVKRILDLYRRSGRFLATVNPQIIDEGSNRIKLVFEINEGKPAKIRKIYIIGAKVFDERDLKAELNSKESKILRFGASEVYDPARIEYDKELLRRFYFSKGYADFEVLSAVGEINQENRWFDITFLIDEGEKYKFGNITITNNIKDVKDERLKKVVKIKKDKIFNANLLNTSVDNITTELAKEGFVFVDVKPMISKNTKDRTIDVDFVIDESPRIYVGEIKIIGNTRTYDDVIRRELRLEEGDPFSLTRFNRSIQRINNLGYFEKVNVTKERGDQPNKLNILIEVQEKKTGELQFGIGYSTTDGANATIGVTENNLLGLGQSLSLNIMYAKYTKNISLSYGKPYFMGRDLYAGFNLFYKKDEDEYSVDYKETTYGGGVNAVYSITEYLDQKLFYSIYRDKISDISEDYDGIITEGDKVTSSVGQSLYYDRKDSRFDPTKGFSLSWTVEYAGIGGDKNYLKNTANANFYVPIWPSIITLRLGAKGGVIDGIGESVNPTDAFYLGGNSLKGFTYGGIGPRTIDSDTGSAKDGSAIGGKRYYVGDAEVKFPLGLPKEYGIYGSFFINAGTLTGVDGSSTLNKNRIVDSGSIRSAAGFSLSWRSPMGPLSFDFSKVLKKESYDESQNFAFSFGTSF